MSVYAQLLSTANRLIKRYGVEYTFTRENSSVYNPDTGKSGIDEPSSYTAYAVVTNNVIGTQASTTNSDDDIILIAVAADYKNNDSVMVEGVRYTIQRTEPIKPGNTKLAQYVFLEK